MQGRSLGVQGNGPWNWAHPLLSQATWSRGLEGSSVWDPEGLVIAAVQQLATSTLTAAKPKAELITAGKFDSSSPSLSWRRVLSVELAMVVWAFAPGFWVLPLDNSGPLSPLSFSPL